MISVVITTYNLERQLPFCLDELFSQTYKDFDVLIVDDCSKDGTRSVIDRYCELCPERIKAVKLEKNLGRPAFVRNKAIDTGLTGKYVVFLDGDDHIEPTFLEKLFTAAEAHSADITFCGYDRVTEEDGRVLCKEMLGFPSCFEAGNCGDTLAFINTSLWNKLILTELIGDSRMPAFAVGEDACFLQELYTKSDKIASVDEVLIHYQVRGTSVISNTALDTIIAFADELLRIHSQCPDRARREVLELTAFIHIGLSMAFRASDNKNIKLSQHLKWTRNYLKNNYGFFRKNSLFKLSNLKKHGFKGLAIWGSLLLYRLNMFRIFLFLYKCMTRILGIDIKF